MSFIKKPVTGMRDILPKEMEIRTRLQQIIRETYSCYGFTEIETPVVEHIENLTSKQGGDNEKLIFKVLKRGDKLKGALDELRTISKKRQNEEKKELTAVEIDSAGNADETLLNAASGTGRAAEEEFSANALTEEFSANALTEEFSANALTEEGLRYDLTLPLSRYYSSNQASLPQPFKALQMGNVFRADRPQKGRFRQFMQCDIDILGDPTNLAEKELILATTKALDNIGFGKYNYYIVINDRRILFELIRFAGMPEEDAEKILIVLDKADKIGADGVDKELLEMGYSNEQVLRLRSVFEGVTDSADGARKLSEKIGTDAAKAAGESIADIMETVSGVKNRNIKLVFDPTLVRGMGYYTGTIFEIKLETFGSSVGGGGRYDKMIGKFTGNDVPAVGFSIGFERIMTILMDDGFDGANTGMKKTAWLIEKGISKEKLTEIFNDASQKRDEGEKILVAWMAKNKKFQKDNLAADGYDEIKEYFKS